MVTVMVTAISLRAGDVFVKLQWSVRAMVDEEVPAGPPCVRSGDELHQTGCG